MGILWNSELTNRFCYTEDFMAVVQDQTERWMQGKANHWESTIDLGEHWISVILCFFSSFKKNLPVNNNSSNKSLNRFQCLKGVKKNPCCLTVILTF